MMPAKFSLTLILLLLTASGAASAQDPVYHVEVIVFARDTHGDALYRWPGRPDISQAVDFQATQAPQTPNFFSDRRPSINTSPLLPASSLFVPLPNEQWIMHEQWGNFETAAYLTPLVQLAWHQPAAAFGEPQPVRVHGGAIVYREPAHQSDVLLGNMAPEPVFMADGTVALERGRYLHLRIDMTLNLPPQGRPPHRSDLTTLQQPAHYQTWRIRQRRQVTPDVVNYFDHRHFGLIALIKEVPAVDDNPIARP